MNEELLPKQFVRIEPKTFLRLISISDGKNHKKIRFTAYLSNYLISQTRNDLILYSELKSVAYYQTTIDFFENTLKANYENRIARHLARSKNVFVRNYLPEKINSIDLLTTDMDEINLLFDKINSEERKMNFQKQSFSPYSLVEEIFDLYVDSDFLIDAFTKRIVEYKFLD